MQGFKQRRRLHGVSTLSSLSFWLPLPALTLDIFIVAERVSFKNPIPMTKSVDPDGTARYEPSRLDLHCLQT